MKRLNQGQMTADIHLTATNSALSKGSMEHNTLEPTIPSALWRYRWLAAAIVFGGVLVGVAFAWLSNPVFRASAEIIVDPGTSAVFESAGSTDAAERYVSDQVQLLQSLLVRERALESVRAIDPSLDVDAQELEEELLTVEADRSNNQISIGVNYKDEQLAIDMTQAMVDSYREVRAEQIANTSSAAIAELDATIASLEDQFTVLQNAIAVETTGTRSELDSQFEETVDQIIALQDELTGTVTAERAVLIDTELARLKLQVDTYQSVKQADSSSPNLAPLVRELDQTIDRRSTLTNLKDQIEIDAALAEGQAFFQASAVSVPKGGGRELAKAGVLGGVIGALSALAITYAFAINRRSFSNRGEPEMITGVPLISEIPDFEMEQITTDLPVQEAPTTRAAEAFRFAAAALDIQLAAADANMLVVVSSTLDDGKSTVVANTAMAAAREGNRVLVVDADFGNQSLTKTLVGDIQPPAGLTEAVDSGMSLRQAVTTVPVADGTTLGLLSRGQRPVVAANFFRSAATRVFFESIRDEYDVILIDTPPLLHVAYASSIARFADAAMLVVSHNGAVGDLEEMVDRLNFIGTGSVGYVYNRSPLRADQLLTEGSLADILGTGDHGKPELKGKAETPPPPAANGSRKTGQAPASQSPAADKRAKGDAARLEPAADKPSKPTEASPPANATKGKSRRRSG
jgi:Mrp family chromosome partitioning ATPase